MSCINGEWSVNGKCVAFGGVDLAYDPESVIDQSEFPSSVFSLNRQNEVTMTFNLTQRQVENLWVVYHGLRSLLAACPSKRVYHNAFNHHKARIREKNRKRAERLIKRRKNYEKSTLE